MFVRELIEGQEIEQVLLVRERELRKRGDGSEYLRLSLGDRTGAVVGVASDGARELEPLCDPGACVRVSGRYELHPRYGAPVTVRRLRPAEPHEYDVDALLDGPPRPVAEMEADAARPHRARCRARTCARCSTACSARTRRPGPRFRDAPAAKRYHQAYRHGLLEHSLSVAQAVAAISRRSRGSTATSRSPARCCTTSASSTPTRPTRWRST